MMSIFPTNPSQPYEPCNMAGWKAPEVPIEEAKELAKTLGADLSKINIEEFRKGITVELEHGWACPQTNITGNDFLDTGKIALVHLYEIPDYYTRLARMEEEAKKENEDGKCSRCSE